SGFERIPYLLYGARAASAGVIRIDSATVDVPSLSPMQALRRGIVLLPADRQRDGGIGTLPLVDNLTIPYLRSYFAHLLLDRRCMSRETRDSLLRFDVRP